MKTIDINADLGEGISPSSIATDVELMKYITSANIACGCHAGSPYIMQKTAINAMDMGVAIGAHPGYNDPGNFGRKSMSLSKHELEALILDQVGALKTIVEAQGGKLKHVKPHGALYNDMAVDYEMAYIVAKAIQKVEPSLVFVGLANSLMLQAGKDVGLVTAHEVFADRAYLNSGLLVPRSAPEALIDSAEVGIAQVLNIVLTGTTTSVGGKELSLSADTVCVHGDNAEALAFVQLLNTALTKENIACKPLGK